MFVVGFIKPVPPQAGKLSIYAYDWDWTDINNTKANWQPLQTHVCTEEELGRTTGEYSKPHLFPSAKGNYDYDKVDGLICLEEQDLHLYGSWQSAIGRILTMHVEICSGHEYCMNETDALNTLKGNLIFLVTNRIRFDSNHYGADAIIKESQAQFLPIMTKA